MFKEFITFRPNILLLSVGLILSLSARSIAQESTQQPASHTEQGYAELESGNQRAAELEFQKALELNPGDLSAKLGIAMIQTERQQHEAAFKSYDSIVREHPQNVFAWNQRGLAAFNLEDFDEALSSFERATADQPVNGFFYESLAWTRMCRGEFTEAAVSAKTATLMYNREGHTTSYPLLIAYFSYLESGDPNNAKRSLHYAIKNHKPNQWPAPVLGYLNGQLNEAELISYVTDSAEETEAHTYIGLRLRNEGNEVEAIKHLSWVSRNGDPRVFEYTVARAINLQTSVAVWKP